MKRILVIDDDIAIRKMLASIIQGHQLGKVQCELADGHHAVEEIEFYNPDIVIVDLLLPGKDGINIVRESIENGFTGKFIMVSQVEDHDMVGSAYEAGCVFFLSKPVNAIEVVSIIKHVSQMIQLEQSLQVIKSTVSGLNERPRDSRGIGSKSSFESQLDSIFCDLGIIGETGIEELKTVLLSILRQKQINPLSAYRLQDFYAAIAQEKNVDGFKNINARSIEQRIRRVIQKAFTTLAEIGQQDYYDLKFSDYSTLLFELGQVKQEIRYLESQTEIRGKINVKRFIEGILSKIRM